MSVVKRALAFALGLILYRLALFALLALFVFVGAAVGAF